MSPKFENIFKGLLDAVKNVGSPEKVKAAFKDGSLLSGKYHELQDCFDAVIAANPPKWRGVTSDKYGLDLMKNGKMTGLTQDSCTPSTR